MLLPRMDITMVKKYVAKQYFAYVDDTMWWCEDFFTNSLILWVPGKNRLPRCFLLVVSLIFPRCGLIKISFCIFSPSLQFSFCILHPACVLLSVCILPLVRSLQPAVSSLRFTLTDFKSAFFHIWVMSSDFFYDNLSVFGHIEKIFEWIKLLWRHLHQILRKLSCLKIS